MVEWSLDYFHKYFPAFFFFFNILLRLLFLLIQIQSNNEWWQNWWWKIVVWILICTNIDGHSFSIYLTRWARSMFLSIFASSQLANQMFHTMQTNAGNQKPEVRRWCKKMSAKLIKSLSIQFGSSKRSSPHLVWVEAYF